MDPSSESSLIGLCWPNFNSLLATIKSNPAVNKNAKLNAFLSSNYDQESYTHALKEFQAANFPFIDELKTYANCKYLGQLLSDKNSPAYSIYSTMQKLDNSFQSDILKELAWSRLSSEIREKKSLNELLSYLRFENLIDKSKKRIFSNSISLQASFLTNLVNEDINFIVDQISTLNQLNSTICSCPYIINTLTMNFFIILKNAEVLDCPDQDYNEKIKQALIKLEYIIFDEDEFKTK